MSKDYFQGRHVELTDLCKEDRKRLRPIIGAVIAAIVIGGFLIYAAKASAEEIPLRVLEKGGVEIRLMDSPCTDPVSVSLIRPDYLARFKAIDSVWPERDGSRKRYAGCWASFTKEEIQSDEDVYLLVFEDRTSGAVPKSEFRKKAGA